LELLRHADGPSPRFGSCYFLLGRAVSQRCTFTWGGSQEDDALERTSSIEAMEPVLAGAGGGAGRGLSDQPGLDSAVEAGLSAPHWPSANALVVDFFPKNEWAARVLRTLAAHSFFGLLLH